MAYLAELHGMWCESCEELVTLAEGGDLAQPGINDMAAECSHWQAIRKEEQSPDWIPVRVQVSVASDDAA